MEKFHMYDELDWSHQEAFHLGHLTNILGLDYIIKEDCIIINGYPITNDMQLSAFVSALKLVVDKDVFSGDDDGTP